MPHGIQFSTYHQPEAIHVVFAVRTELQRQGFYSAYVFGNAHN